MKSMALSLELPTPKEYRDMRELCGLAPRTLEASETALKHSLHCVCIRSEDNMLVAMGRVVGDLGSHVQVVDIAVRPEFQKQGLSKLIMNNIMGFVRDHVHETAFVNLFADVDYLYQKFGFRKPKAMGMYLDRSTNEYLAHQIVDI